MEPTHTTIRLELCNKPDATFTLRRALDRVAADCELPDDARFELKLAATEAVTNALKGTPREYAVEVAVACTDGVVDVEVVDRGHFEPRIQEDSPVDAESGRGISLMLALVDEIEFASARHGTRVRLRKHASRSSERHLSF
jgi:anti-sigma regulatory factor (Ser/Thr protein kinase)